MSTQTGILSKFDSKKLWTVPSKDQYLPAYFKRLCDHYLTDSNPRRVYPVEVGHLVLCMTDDMNVNNLKES